MDPSPSVRIPWLASDGHNKLFFSFHFRSRLVVVARRRIFSAGVGVEPATLFVVVDDVVSAVARRRHPRHQAVSRRSVVGGKVSVLQNFFFFVVTDVVPK